MFVMPLFGQVFGQGYSTSSKKAIKRFEEARNCYRTLDHACVEERLKKSLKADADFLEAYQMLAQLFFDQGRIDEAISSFTRSLEIDPEGNPDGYRLLAGLTMMTGDYSGTLQHIEKFLSFPVD